MSTMMEIIFSGFVSKIINDGIDTSKDKIINAVNRKNTANQNLESQIYNVIVNVLEDMYGAQYEDDPNIVYDTAEKFLLGVINNKESTSRTIRFILQESGLNVDKFKRLLCKEIGRDENKELYHAITLLQNDKTIMLQRQINQKQNETNEMIKEIKSDFNMMARTQQNTVEKGIIESRTQEYADKWYENMFLNNFDEWDENSGENVILKDVYIEDNLPHFKYAGNKKEFDQLKKLLFQYITPNKENQMLFIQGQPGIGKSTLVTWITAHFKNDNILVYKCVPDLDDIDWESNRILNKILEKLELTHDDLNGKRIIFDGFDEINIKGNRKEILEKLYDNLQYGKLIKNCSLIITCRENYISGFERLTCKNITLQPWDEKQIRSFCTIFQAKAKSEISESKMKIIIQNKDVFGIPLILYMALALNISIEEDYSVVQVYDKIFSLKGGIYDRCIGNKSFDSLHRIGAIKKQIHQISREIALWMFENKSEAACIPQEEYQNICVAIVQDIKKESVDPKQDFLIGNYFKLVKHCEGADTSQLYFVHRSMYEYFVAEYFFSSIYNTLDKSKEELAGVCGEFLKGNELSELMLDFLKYKIRNSVIDKEFDKINEAFQMMLQDGMTYYMKERVKNVIDCEFKILNNMLKIIRLWNNGILKPGKFIIKYINYNNFRSDLTGADLRGLEFSIFDFSKIILNEVNFSGEKMRKLDLSNSQLCGACFRDTNLKFSNLENSKLSYANLENADLRDANLKGAELKGTNLRGANLEGNDLSHTCIEGVNLQKANLKGAYLRNVDLRKTCLSCADLRNADLKNVLLEDTNLYKADLRSANLESADFRGANIIEIKMDSKSLKGAIFDESQITYLEQKNYFLQGTLVYSGKAIISYEEYRKSCEE